MDEIKLATENEADEILRLYDEAVEWMVANGNTSQWGTEPLSKNETFAERVKCWLRAKRSYLGLLDGRIVGFVALSTETPEYIGTLKTLVKVPSYYVVGLISDRNMKGNGIGKILLHYADKIAHEQKHKAIYLDCWSGSAKLPEYYENNGYERLASFEVGKWPGVLMEKQLTTME